MAERYGGILPHEILMGERDVPGQSVPLWLIFFDIQATELLIKIDNEAAKARR